MPAMPAAPPQPLQRRRLPPRAPLAVEVGCPDHGAAAQGPTAVGVARQGAYWRQAPPGARSLVRPRLGGTAGLQGQCNTNARGGRLGKKLPGSAAQVAAVGGGAQLLSGAHRAVQRWAGSAPGPPCCHLVLHRVQGLRGLFSADWQPVQGRAERAGAGACSPRLSPLAGCRPVRGSAGGCRGRPLQHTNARRLSGCAATVHQSAGWRAVERRRPCGTARAAASMLCATEPRRVACSQALGLPCCIPPVLTVQSAQPGAAPATLCRVGTIAGWAPPTRGPLPGYPSTALAKSAAWFW